MNKNSAYLKYTLFIFYMVFLVILAGGVVRMTQSGMGCPDWPKCFGRWIPPTSPDQLPPDFEKYLGKQDIDHTFNAYHTWIEYINRLLGALLGFFIIIHVFWSTRLFWNKNKRVVLYSFLLLLAVAFNGWLGKRVVDENLEAVKVTTHMLAALVVAGLPLFIINTLKEEWKVKDSFIKHFSVFVIIIVLVQVVLGTQVREQIDIISKTYKYTHRENWIGELDNLFIIHRSFTWVVALSCLVLVWRSSKYRLLKNLSVFIVSVLAVTIIAGIIMMYFNIPAIAQPTHLLLACVLVISLLAFRLKCI